MEFTSGGTEGFKLNKKLYDIPEELNMYGTIEGINSKLELVSKFHQLGWSVRKSSWTDYEVENEWTELCIQGENEILLSGILDEQKFEELGDLLNSFGVKYNFELVDEFQILKRTISNK
ncbi:hypothetical protein GCM10009122_48630 [Fulvivirga kasyanovii]|uniref:hypothetical protein n=1 Tax=Fulvivirga kasyanovii TaxID=396812 RepID=UPI0031D78133